MKKFLIGLLGIVMVASMSACSSDSPASGTMPGAKESPAQESKMVTVEDMNCLLYTSPSPRDGLLSRMPSSA